MSCQDVSACDDDSKGRVQFLCLFVGAREVGAAVAWMGSAFNSPEAGMKALLFQ